MLVVKLFFLLSIIFATYVLIDVIWPALNGNPPFTLWRYIFKGIDYDNEVKEYKSKMDFKDN